MAVAFVQEFDIEPGDRSTTNYDKIRALLNPDVDKPAGVIVHTAGFTGNVFRIFDVWESEEDFKRFESERLMPAVGKVMAESADAAPPDRQYIYELHDVVRA